jgi:hypothetical protein
MNNNQVVSWTNKCNLKQEYVPIPLGYGAFPFTVNPSEIIKGVDAYGKISIPSFFPNVKEEDFPFVRLLILL